MSKEKPWGAFESEDDEPPHVIPIHDLIAHVESGRCVCDPQLLGGVWVHNAFDERELEEAA